MIMMMMGREKGGSDDAMMMTMRVYAGYIIFGCMLRTYAINI